MNWFYNGMLTLAESFSVFDSRDRDFSDPGASFYFFIPMHYLVWGLLN